MEVICPKCKTTYDFEDTLIGPKGTVVRCTQCGYMFKIFRSNAPDALETAGWMVRKKEGQVYNIDKFSTLQKWIIEGKITTDDELSRTGKTWKRIGEIVELSGLFKVSQLSTVQRGVSPKSKEEEPTVKLDELYVSKMKAMNEPSAVVSKHQEEEWKTSLERSETVPVGEPSASFQNAESATVKGALARTLESERLPEEDESILKPVYQPRRGKHIAIAAIIIVCLIPAIYLGIYYRGKLVGCVGMIEEPKSRETLNEETLLKAKVLIAKETPKSLEDAEGILKSLIEKDGNNINALIELSQIYAILAQYKKDEIDFLELRADPSVETAALQTEFASLLSKAQNYVNRALRIQPDKMEVQRANADVLRLSGNFDSAAEAIELALKSKPDDARSIYIKTMIDYEKDKNLESAILGLNRALRKDEGLVSAIYHLALFLKMKGMGNEANLELGKILGQDNEHTPAVRLMKLLSKPSPLIASSTPDAYVEGDVKGDIAIEGGEVKYLAKEAQAKEAQITKTQEKEEETFYPSGQISIPSGKSFESLVSQGSKLQDGDHCDRAIEYFKKALEINPQSSQVWTSLGDCLSDLGRKGEAVNAYRKALSYNSRYGPAIIAIADISKQQGKLKLALEYYKKYLEVYQAGPQASLAKRNVTEIEDILKAKGESAEEEEKAQTKENTEGGGDVEKKPAEETQGEVKSSIGQPTKDRPKMDKDPYP